MKMTFYVLSSIFLVISTALFAFMAVWNICAGAKTWDIVENLIMFTVSGLCMFDAFRYTIEEDRKRREKKLYK